MKEKAIRPADLKKKCRQLFEKDAKELLRFKNRFVEIGCPACAKEQNRIYLVKKGYAFKRCDKCRTLYISPRPTPDILKYYYTNSRASKFWQKYIFPRTKRGRVEKIYKLRVDKILDYVNRYRIKTDLLVDIGAGSGFFGQEVARRKVFEKIVLIEPGPIKLKKQSPINIINSSFEECILKGKPDVVTTFELIEHLFSPRDFLENIYSIMNKKGLLMFTVPNLEGFEVSTIFDKSTNIAGPDHLNYFNTDSIKVLLESLDFKDIEISTPGELDADIARNSHLEGIIDLSKQPFLYHMLIEKPDEYIEKFQEFLKENKLSSHMMVVARK